MTRSGFPLFACTALVMTACVAPGATGASNAGVPAARTATAAQCSRSGARVPPVSVSPPAGLRVHAGFRIQTVAQIGSARELAALPDGDLLVGTEGSQVYIVPDAEGSPGEPQVFATLDDAEAAGVAFSRSRCAVYVGTTNHVWRIPYTGGERRATRIESIADVRTGPVAPHSDGDDHTTNSVAFDDSTGVLYVSVGSSCNACTEVDPTRASILDMASGSAALTKRATRIRNAMAVFVDPASGALWAGGAGQDDLPFWHPYEFLDDVSSHHGIADYGWPQCEENHHAYTAGANCTKTVEPLVELTAYSTIIGATFYPLHQSGAYAFPTAYRGGIFAAAHGSWHTYQGNSAAASRVVFVPMNGDKPRTPVDWKDPTTQWTTFVGGFQESGTDRRGRPTGVAVGPKGSLFVADDASGLVYRIRPAP